MRWLRIKLIYLLTRGLLPVPSETDVLMFNKRGQAFIDNALITGSEMQNLRAEVRFLEESRIWKLMNTYFHNLTYKKLLDTSDEIGILYVKAVLQTLDVQNTIIKKVKALKDS